MSIIKDALQKQLDELRTEVHNIEKKHEQILEDGTHELVDQLSVLFKDFSISVSDTDIQFITTKGGWDRFRISRQYNFHAKETEYKYSKPYVSLSSLNSDDEESLRRLVCVGKLAEQQLKDSDIWKDLNRIMDSNRVLYNEDLREKKNNIWNLENEIKNIENKERDNKCESVFDKGTFKLTKRVYFSYGSSRYDYVNADEFTWERNGTGKTFTMFFTDEKRANPYYDENGNHLEPVFEKTKRAIDKRIRENDLRSFIHTHMNNMIEEK